VTYRVIQWATGAMGKTCLKAVIDHPGFELAGVYVYGASKAGKDAGDIARRAQTGVIATNDVDAILALEADVVIHAGRLAPPYGSHDAELIRILESGKNVISINGYSVPGHGDEGRRAALEAACRKGGVSLMGAGLNPGFAGEQLAVIASGLCSELDLLEVVESVSCIEVAQPAYVFDALGFGADPAVSDPNDDSWGPAQALNGMYEEVLTAIALRLGLRLDSIERRHRAMPATHDLKIGAGVIPKGRIGHFNWRWHGMVNGAPRLALSIHWYMETAHLDEPAPPLWRVNIEGKPGVRISVDLHKRASETERTSAEQFAVAGMVLNSIPALCAAKPGLLLRPMATPFVGA
jgi:hypothetical protein